ncbi:unnamed protein product [Auanema sp. JU1783]|nr:unnamed protein product [Auanema sp. JU1783]
MERKEPKKIARLQRVKRPRGRRRYGQNEDGEIGEQDETASTDSGGIPGVLVIPGYHYDPNTKKYFKITPGWTPKVPEPEKPVVLAKPKKINPLLLMNDFNCGAIRHNEYSRRLREGRIFEVNPKPSAIYEIVNPSSFSVPLNGCQFMEPSVDGKTIFSCWSSSNNGYQDEKLSRITIKVSYDPDIAEKAHRLEDSRTEEENLENPCNKSGIYLACSDISSDLKGNSLVDACVARVDKDVTCCLYVVAGTMLTEHGLRSRCSVKFEPLPEFCTRDYFNFQSSPIYNQKWAVDCSVYSCGWSGNKMRVSIGMGECARILDIIAESSFVISSKKKNVISQQFSSDGNLLFMGLRAENAIQSDLRMPSKHVTASLKGTRNTSYLRVLEHTHPNSLVTDTFAGELKLWDLRRPDRELREFKGHANSHYRLPAFVDSNEQFLFAVGEDEVTRGWSLATGDMLCEIPSPCPSPGRTDFPRVVYNDSWGGRVNNPALIIANGNSCRVHPLFH